MYVNSRGPEMRHKGSELAKQLHPIDISQIGKFCANCHLANNWTCFVEHRL